MGSEGRGDAGGAVWQRGGLIARLAEGPRNFGVIAHGDGVPVGLGVGSIRSVDVLGPVREAEVALAPTRGLVVAVAVVRRARPHIVIPVVTPPLVLRLARSRGQRAALKRVVWDTAAG